ncbi:MAG TPA: SRPBCC family protein [Baekduia sp.]|uniref:SRPBCC family protein n=1 Tax=Baekduia sp. TaxID=2600305 RepID=UPI002D1E324D|nr:SRPBCC family protein [Baekduia sp.]HMJ33538.1 SRPBCC family protein [Baekduia sp.]
MKPISVSTTVDRPRQEVFEHLDVLANHLPFLDHFMVDAQLSGPPSGVGAHVRFRALSPGRSEWMESTVAAVEPGVSVAEDTVGARGRRRLRGTYRLADAGPDRRSTLVTFELVTVDAPAVERLAAPLVRPWLTKQNARALARLKEQLEGRDAATAAA